jgi:hypothetical protein
VKRSRAESRPFLPSSCVTAMNVGADSVVFLDVLEEDMDSRPVNDRPVLLVGDFKVRDSLSDGMFLVCYAHPKTFEWTVAVILAAKKLDVVVTPECRRVMQCEETASLLDKVPESVDLLFLEPVGLIFHILRPDGAIA